MSEFGFQFDGLLAKFDLRRTFQKVIAALARVSLCNWTVKQRIYTYINTCIHITHMYFYINKYILSNRNNNNVTMEGKNKISNNNTNKKLKARKLL